MKKAIIIGSGFAGLSSACFLAKSGWDVTVIEKNSTPGGRARQLKSHGFTFDMGPSWYWMPDVFEWFFNHFSSNNGLPYTLERLDPSYSVYWPQSHDDIPADYRALIDFFEKTEQGAGSKLEKFLEEAAYKYDVGIHKLVHKPGKSLTEFADVDLIKGIFKLDVFVSMRKHVASFFTHPYLKQLMEFPVLFLGALPKDIPALYSLMNYADARLGTWYPEGGMYSVVEGMYNTAIKMGVTFQFDTAVTKINTSENNATGVDAISNDKKVSFKSDVIIANADYHFTEQHLLEERFRTYSPAYWEKRVMAPSSLIFYVGLNKKLANILHHNLFFDVDFEKHGEEIYTTKSWPENPLFYVSVTSVTDHSTAPAGYENIFILIPIAAGLEGDNEEVRNKYFDIVLSRMEQRLGESILPHVVFKKSYCVSDFVHDYNAFKGNAYGLANTLLQTANLKPALQSKKIKNLYFTGQLTVPGPGVPPAIISGKVVANEINKQFKLV